ncbi:hypothetical protein BVI1335_70082 [Burkholderia vietnamiensis]|nr:hypothetical protein BVI1335_70082 [Burkholderia vietnamiensis]
MIEFVLFAASLCVTQCRYSKSLLIYAT